MRVQNNGIKSKYKKENHQSQKVVPCKKNNKLTNT